MSDERCPERAPNMTPPFRCVREEGHDGYCYADVGVDLAAAWLAETRADEASGGKAS